MASNNYEMDKCLQISLKKYIDNDKININDNIVILYHYPFDRCITHYYINNNGEKSFSSKFGEQNLLNVSYLNWFTRKLLKLYINKNGLFNKFMHI